MKTETKPAGPCPTFFRAACRKAATGGHGNGYDWAGHTLAGHVPELIDEGDDDARAAKLEALSDALWRRGPNGLVRGVNVFLISPDADEVLAWFDRELPRCMGLIPAPRRTSFLRGVYRYVVEQENDITTW